jgi:hypothetical protein
VSEVSRTVCVRQTTFLVGVHQRDFRLASHHNWLAWVCLMRCRNLSYCNWSDEDESNSDGISGRAAEVVDPFTGDNRLGRFGYKGATSSVRHQVAVALNTDMGVMTSTLTVVVSKPVVAARGLN